MKKKVWKSMTAAVALLALAIGCEQPSVEPKPTEPVSGNITNTAFIEAVDNAKDSQDNLVNIGWDKNEDGTVKLTEENLAKIQAVTELDISKQKLTDLSGIEWFTGLTTLYCSGNQLRELDVKANTALTTLDCTGNQLTELDVSANTALTELYCSVNQLTELDVSANTTLTKLSCYDNQLTELDVKSNTVLTTLDCTGNQLTELDVSANTAMEYLGCSDNQLTSLDVKANTALKWLDCYDNQLTELDVKANTALTDLYCGRQTSDGETAQTLTLTLSPEQRTKWENEWKNSPSNDKVNVTAAE